MYKFIDFCNYFFLIYMVVYASYILICGVFGSIRMYQYRKKEIFHNVLSHEFYYPMSIVVPAYNESLSIVQSIQNLLLLDYKHYEIIIVNDGSTDDTKERVLSKFNLKKEEGMPIRYSLPCKPITEVYEGEVNGVRLVLISKENGKCKADASNAGINVSKYPYIVNIDADEILQRDALKIAGRSLFENENVVCVGGSIKMSNGVTFENAMPVKSKLGRNIITDMQVIEYGRAFVGTRIFQNEMNMNLIVSGGFGIFKKSVLLEVGGFDNTSMGEDMELTCRIHQYYRKNKKPYSMKYVPDSVCWTQGPATMKDLRKQRRRWYCGLIQTLWKYKYMILNPRYGILGMFMFPYVIAYELLNPFFLLIGWFVIIWTLLDNTIGYPFVMYVYILYLIFGIMLSMLSFFDKIYMKLDGISLKKVLVALYTSVVDALFFRMYISLISFFAIFKMKKLKGKWESPTRVVVESTEMQ